MAAGLSNVPEQRDFHGIFRGSGSTPGMSPGRSRRHFGEVLIALKKLWEQLRRILVLGSVCSLFQIAYFSFEF